MKPPLPPSYEDGIRNRGVSSRTNYAEQAERQKERRRQKQQHHRQNDLLGRKAQQSAMTDRSDGGRNNNVSIYCQNYSGGTLRVGVGWVEDGEVKSGRILFRNCTIIIISCKLLCELVVGGSEPSSLWSVLLGVRDNSIIELAARYMQ